MAYNDFVTNIANADTDAQALSKFMQGANSEVVKRRIANDIKTLQYYIDYLHGLELVYSQTDGFVNVNGTQVKTVTQAIKDAINAASVQNGLGDALVAIKNSQLVAGGYDRTLQDKHKDRLTVKDFGAIGDGTLHPLSERFSTLAAAQAVYPHATALTNSIDWAAIQACANYAINKGYAAITLTDGNFIIDKTLNLGNLSMIGTGMGSQITPTINDGSSAVNVSPSSNFFYLKDFRIWSGASTRPNCIGLSSGKTDSDANAANRYKIDNVQIHGLRQGADVSGWIGDIQLFIDYCDIGFVGRSLNAGRYKIDIEQCTEAGRINGVQGSTLQLSVEGASSTVQKGFLIDAIYGGVIVAPYFETSGTVAGILEYFCKIGTVSQCVGVRIDGGATFGYGVNDAYWVFDQIDGLTVDDNWAQGSQQYSQGRLYRTTANTKRIRRLNFITPQNLSFWIKDKSTALKPYQNLFANGSFLAGIKGFRRIDALVSATVTKITDITRSASSSAIKVQTGAGVLGGNGSFTFPNVIYKNYKSKKVFLGVWLYVPDIAEYNDFSLKAPYVALNDGVKSTLSGLTLFSKGDWHFVIVQHTLDVNATELTMKVAPVGYKGATVTAADITGNEYVVVGGVYLLDNSSEVDAHRVANGFVENSGFSGRIVGENIELYADDLTGINSAAGWGVGDKIVFQNSDFIQEYVCINTTPQFRPTRWINKAFATANLPTLTTSDVGVGVFDTTTGTFKRWSGSAWI